MHIYIQIIRFMILNSSPKKSKSSSVEHPQQRILVTYDDRLSQLIPAIFTKIHKQYADVYILDKESEEQITNYKQNMTLKKRSIKFMFLEKFNKNVLINNKQYTRKLHYCDGECSSAQIQKFHPSIQIFLVKPTDDANTIQKMTTKMLHLDFIWLGVTGRLGASISQFYTTIKQFEKYTQFQSSYALQFLKHLNTELEPLLLKSTIQNNQYIESEMYLIFQKCSKKAQQKQKQIQDDLIDLICQRYNEHILVASFTYHNYYLLAKTRNYFKSIWIQESPLKRYKNFKLQFAHNQEFSNLQKWVNANLQNFLHLDEYFYQKHLQKIAHCADFCINTGITKHNYRDLIQQNYKQIFRKFRPDFDEYFISICQVLKVRAGCIKEAVGSIIVKNKRILSTGYNGTPMGSVDCFNGGCAICNNSNIINTVVLSCNCIHAEYSCIIEAGIQSTPGCVLYTTQLPCLWCAKVICQAKIIKVVYRKTDSALLEYDNQKKVLQIFKLAGIQCVEFSWGEHKFSKI